MTEQELEALQKDPEGTHECPKCKKPVSNERPLFMVESGLKPTMKCLACTPKGFLPKAVLDFEGNEGDGMTLIVCLDEKNFKAAKSANISIDEDVELPSEEEEESTNIKVEKL
jgi:hypothetical protein